MLLFYYYASAIEFIYLVDIYMINIRYFGALKDMLGLASEQLDWLEGTTDDLLAQLRQRGPQWSEALSEDNVFRLVVNQQIIYKPVLLKQHDEVAILPPVTGG